MFSGYIQDHGVVIEAEGAALAVEAEAVCAQLHEGSQVALSGVRTSVDRVNGRVFSVTLSAETRRRSTLGDWQAGRRVNLELPLSLGDRVQGHFVQGHVDAVGKVLRVDEDDASRRLWIRPPERMLPGLIAKGSIAIDGVSLTVAEVIRDRFSVALVPSTLERTTLADVSVGDRVNLEGDLLQKIAPNDLAVQRRIRRCVAPSPWSGLVTGKDGVQKVVQQIRSGGAVLVWDPERETEGDVVVAGSKISPEHFTFILTQACSHATVPCAASVLERLEIPPMNGDFDHHKTWMYTPVDLASEPGTGVSAAQRAATVRRLAAPDSVPEDFVSPGHVFPLRGRDGGLEERRGHTEATIALCTSADLPPVGVCCEVMNPDGSMAGPEQLERRALEWEIPLIDIADLQRYL